ncbi:hypothetical protein [Paenibacillus sp. DR312]|uniref:hypothetical protein n=1 Tax=unclassified Paenibacillus TaxID=185978 RepID=UPI001C9568D8|nr:hypothetical protein [Paenibacillus sp. DR312]QZN76208.1 hypothetical protein K5K90_02550 [Paenibacillus sp. DR312]
MGQYLQMGICHQMLIGKREIGKTTIDNIKGELGKLVNLELFDFEESEENIFFIIKESVVQEQLHMFLSEQFSFYDQSYAEDFSELLSEIEKRKSLVEIIELAEEKEFRFFQHNNVYDSIEISPWQTARVDTSLFAIFIEGKLLMESYNSFLHYLEELVRARSSQAISGAFRAFID